MRKSLGCLLVLGLAINGCGKNQVTVEIRGGGGTVRLDANDLQFRFNHLVQPGVFVFPTLDSGMELRRGAYTVNVAGKEYLETQVVEIGAPPLFGVQDYPLVFSLPADGGDGFTREGTIVYAATRTDLRNWELFTLKADGSAPPVQLTHTREFEQHPRWSPDGRQILFTRGDVMTNIDLYVMDADGSNERRLTSHPERDQRGCWSPDGRQIAFVSQRDGDVAIWIMDADGANKRKLVNGRDPSWSPDGRRMVFTSGHFDGWDEIYMVDLDGGNLQRLTFNKDRFDVFARWSPDGRRIAFTSERFGGQELMLMKPDGAAQTRITVAENTYFTEAVWSPDGRGLAFAGKMQIGPDGELVFDDRGRPQGSYDIYLMPVTGFDWDQAAVRDRLPLNLTNSDEWDAVSPSWRPF